MDGAAEIPSEIATEETTEPFSSSEYAALLRASRTPLVDGTDAGSTQPGDDGTGVHLDELVVPPDKDIRLLVRPLRSRSVSPGLNDNCQWVALRAEVTAANQPHETVLAVTQTSEDIKFTVHVPGGRHSDSVHGPPLWCELYYDPASDNQILLSHCDVPITLSRVFSPTSAGLGILDATADTTSNTADAFDTPGTPGTPSTPSAPRIEYTINPGTVKALSPGTWRIKVGPVAVLDFRILEKRQPVLKPLGSPIPQLVSTPSTASATKRPFSDDDDDWTGPNARRQKTNGPASDDNVLATRDGKMGEKNNEAVIMFLSPAVDPLVFPLPTEAKTKAVATADADLADSSHALLDMDVRDTLVVQGGCEMDSYQLTKRETILSPAFSSVFTGTVAGHPNIPPDSVITVKVVKTRPPETAAPAVAAPARIQQDRARVVVRQADTWLREYKSHEYLRHDSIVRLYGGDARFLSLYMEHVDAKDLSIRGVWREPGTDAFTGDRADAQRILRDIASALEYIHSKALVHNDIKPANILYSRTRGAVLCDFGLSTHSSAAPSEGGTPFYVPPEFIGRRQRGPPSDVWALGITMLYVLRAMALPGTRGGRRRNRPALYWMIADINRGGAVAAHGAAGPTGGEAGGPLPAVVQMQMWLSEVNEAKERLSRDDWMEKRTLEMLVPNPAQRTTMKRVVGALHAEA